MSNAMNAPRPEQTTQAHRFFRSISRLFESAGKYQSVSIHIPALTLTRDDLQRFKKNLQQMIG